MITSVPVRPGLPAGRKSRIPMKAHQKTLTGIEEFRKDFPNLHRKVHGKPLVYLDNAATTLKPKSVIEALEKY